MYKPYVPLCHKNAANGLVVFIPTSITLKMNLSTNKAVFKSGENLILNLSLSNEGPDETGDLYLVMLTPNGTIYSGLDWSKSVHPAAANFTIPEGFSLPETKVLEVTLPVDKPPITERGTYYFAIGLADTGSTYFRSMDISTFEVVD